MVTAINFGRSGKNIFDVGIKGIAPYRSSPDNFDSTNARVKINITVENTQISKTEGAYISINDRQTNTRVWSKDYSLSFRNVINGAINFNEKVELDSSWSAKPYRVVIRLYELHESDPLRIKRETGNRILATPQHEYGERMIFMDVFEINGSA